MAKYKLRVSGKFKKDFKKFKNKPRELKGVEEVLRLLKQGVETIPQQMKPHKLVGNYKGLWECHVFPDLLLIWEQFDEPDFEIHLIRLGSHSDLFRK